MNKKFLAGAFAFLVASSLFSADIEVQNLRARTSKPGTNNSAVFMDIKNNSNNDVKLVSAVSSVCKSTEIHTHKHENGMMAMVQISSVDIPQNSLVKLAPGGLHIMLIELNSPIKEGDKVDLEMKFDNGETLKFNEINVTENFK